MKIMKIHLAICQLFGGAPQATTVDQLQDPAVAALVPNMGSPCVQPANPGQAQSVGGCWWLVPLRFCRISWDIHG